MKHNWWLRFGCFLTGYNFQIVNLSSEVAANAVKRYTSAMLIVCILWSFIGYAFTQRYLGGSIIICLVGAIVFCTIIIQIERQIILSDSASNAKYYIRGFIAVTMAIIGSIIIDQMIFKGDIEKKKLFTITSQVDSLMPSKQAELKNQLSQLDSTIAQKEFEKSDLIKEITNKPFLKVSTSQTIAVPLNTITTDSLKQSITKARLAHTTNTTVNAVQNPKVNLLNPLNEQINLLRMQKMSKGSSLIALRSIVEKEVNSKVGFLDELKMMYSILADSGVALFVWLLWFALLLGIELFIMVNKIGAKENDYDLTIYHHMELQKRKLHLMAQSIPLEK